MSESRSRYAEKRRSGRMMYGPAPTTGQWPSFQVGTCYVACECRACKESGTPLKHNQCPRRKAIQRRLDMRRALGRRRIQS